MIPQNREAIASPFVSAASSPGPAAGWYWLMTEASQTPAPDRAREAAHLDFRERDAGRRRRHRNQLDPAAGRGGRGREGLRARASLHRDPARTWRGHLRPARRRRDRGRLQDGRRVHRHLRATRARGGDGDRHQRGQRRRELRRLPGRAPRALRAQCPDARGRRGGRAYLPGRGGGPPAGGRHPGDRHRRRLYRARLRLRARRSLLRLASGRNRPPHGALPEHRPARGGRPRGARRRRSRADLRRAGQRADFFNVEQGDRGRRARPHRSPQSSRSSTPTTPSASTGFELSLDSIQRMSRCSPR